MTIELATDAIDRPHGHANRAEGALRATFTAVGSRTGPGRIFETGGLRLRCPRVGPGLHPDCEAVTINTAGGMVGGDTARLDFTAGAGAAVTITSQSAEKIYRSTGRPTEVDTVLRLDAGAQLEWLPQETILFDQADFRRRLTVDMAPDASLLIAEGLVFGRLAFGEVMRRGAVRDQWRVRRGGALAFAEALVLQGDVLGQLDRPALGGGARALATVLLVSPRAETMLEPVRAALGTVEGCQSGASAWNGLLLTRVLSPSPAALRNAMVATLAALRGRATPRVWQ